MRRAARDRMTTLGFVALSLAIAFWQKPGWATSDTKIDLHVDPGRFLSGAASVWTATTDLGEVHSAQYTGYLWPMGPFFAGLHWLGLAPWVVQRLWLGVIFALSVWGVLRLLDLLVGGPRGVVHVVAAAVYLFNPYVAVFTARTSITLLGYAALPWLLIVACHGIRSARGLRGSGAWGWAAAFALIVASIGGGVNAAVVAWVLVGPLVLVLYEPVIGSVRWRDAFGFLARAGALALLASLWWIVPLLVHVRYGIDFLQFTEQPQSIWATNSVTESLRLMGYWTSYLGVGFDGVNRPFFSDGATFLFNVPVVGASLMLPALAVAGFALGRRRTYAPLFLALMVVGAVIMMAGFPAGTPLRRGMDWIYHQVFVVRFLRTTNKAAPLVALGLAGLLGLGAQQVWARLRLVRKPQVRHMAMLGSPLALAGLIVLAALPLFRGKALDSQLLWKRIPAAWREAGAGLHRGLAPDARALILPGQIFAYYRWGGTVDAVLPRLTDRPVAVRYETPYSDLHAVDLLTTVDDLVQQRRLVPGQLPPLLRLMGVGAVVTGADDDISRSGAIAPAAAAPVLAEQGLGRPSRSYGPTRSLPPARGDIGAPVVLPQVRRYDAAPGRGIVHVDPLGPPTVVDGGASGLADLAAFGALPETRPILYAGDLSTRELRAQAARGADLVVSDSNRRRAFLPELPQQNRGPTLTASDPIDVNTAVLDPFPARGTDAQTVDVLQGARYIRAPSSPGELQFPEHRPAAAFDGDLATSWIADRYLPTSDRWIEIGLPGPQDVPYVDVNPVGGTHGTVTEVDVNGVHAHIGAGWTRIRVHLRHVATIRITIDHVLQPRVGLGGPAGFSEIRIPGVHVHELLRSPILLGRALAGQDLSHSSLTYLFERTMGDDPFLRNVYRGAPVLNDPLARGDGEQYLDRAVFAPARRSYRPDAWVYPAVSAPDSALDRLMGSAGAVRFDSSGRFEDQARYRASRAFTGRPGSAWVGVWEGSAGPSPWISWSAPRPLALSELHLTPAPFPVRRPTLVRLSWGSGATPPLPVSPAGRITLPQPARASAFRLTILQARFGPGAPAYARQANAVGIGSLSVPGLAPARAPAHGRLRAPCGSVRVDVAGRTVPLAPSGTIAQLEAGQPLTARSCTGPVSMRAGINEVRALPGTFSVDLLRLRSGAPLRPPSEVGSGRVVDPGHLGNSSVSGARVALEGPSWLVLGQSFDTGWRATCDGRSLGRPRVIDGYASGWMAPARCRRVTFSFAPQSGVRVSYLASALASLTLVAYLVLTGLRRRRATSQPPTLAMPPAPATPPALAMLPEPLSLRVSLPRAAAIALVAAVPLGAIFAIRAGVALFLVLAFVLWRGAGPRALAAGAAALLGIVVPVLYAAYDPANRGGFNFTYSVQLIWAHWVGVAALVLVGLAGWRMIGAARGARRQP